MVFIPIWMAPNLVTVIGLLFTTASYVLMYYTAPGMRTEDTPSWVFPTAAFGLFIYQTLDNMDGKQVRCCMLPFTYMKPASLLEMV